MAENKPDSVSPVSGRHAEWREHQVRWRWLQDSYEGADRYRQAVYGYDSRGLPIRNLIRHKREYPDPMELQTAGFGTVVNMGLNPIGSDPSIQATNDDYEMRRARTPVPTFVREAVDRDLAKIFSRKPTRTIPDTGFDDLKEWTEDVDGQGTSLAAWMEQVIGPLFLVLGQLDLMFDHPPKPDNEEVVSLADEERLGLSRCVVSYALPENVLSWKLDSRGQYKQVVIREYSDPDGDQTAFQYRIWDRAQSQLYDDGGEKIGPPVPHAYGVTPVIRIFDRRKPRCRNVGMSRYEATAERQREFYNRDSELILSDSTQSHPLLQGPEDFVQADGTIPIGPSWLLPKKKSAQGGTVTYEGFDVIDFPKGGAESLRQNKAEIRDDVDRDCGMTKPAGIHGTGRSTVAQSGLSKVMDAIDGNDRLASIAKSLAKLEKTILRYVLVVLRNDPNAAELAEQIDVAYPVVFALSDLNELGDGLTAFQALLDASGGSPELETLTLCQMARKLLPGYPDSVFDLIEEQIRNRVEANALTRSQVHEGNVIATQTVANAEAAEREVIEDDDNDNEGNPVGAAGNQETGAGGDPVQWIGNAQQATYTTP